MSNRADQDPSTSAATTLALEVVPLPVTDVDRAIDFYTRQVGFALDVDYRPIPGFRIVQLTPPGSSCSVHLVAGDPSTALHTLYLVTTDLQATRDRLVARGVAFGALRHKDPVAAWTGDFAPGIDPQRRDYASFADFSDPDGNTWTVQERGHRP